MHTPSQIFFHVGLGKVASTYLQYRFFPKLQGIHYIQRTKYKHYQKYIKNAPLDKILLSREMDNQLDYELSRFSKDYPDAKIIILFRRHDGWMASQYRRYIKNGGYRTFNQFFDLKNDQGLWKTEQARMMPKIEIIKKYFHQPPLVLFYEDLKNEPFTFFDKIAAYTGTTYSLGSVSLQPVHTSYSEKQLKFIRRMASHLFAEPDGAKHVIARKGVRHWWHRRSKMLACYATMYAARFFPDDWAGAAPLIAKEDLEEVRAYFAEDWRQLKDYGKNTENYLRASS